MKPTNEEQKNMRRKALEINKSFEEDHYFSTRPDLMVEVLANMYEITLQSHLIQGSMSKENALAGMDKLRKNMEDYEPKKDLATLLAKAIMGMRK